MVRWFGICWAVSVVGFGIRGVCVFKGSAFHANGGGYSTGMGFTAYGAFLAQPPCRGFGGGGKGDAGTVSLMDFIAYGAFLAQPPCRGFGGGGKGDAGTVSLMDFIAYGAFLAQSPCRGFGGGGRRGCGYSLADSGQHEALFLRPTTLYDRSLSVTVCIRYPWLAQ